jgi:hypothetical protein
LDHSSYELKLLSRPKDLNSRIIVVASNASKETTPNMSIQAYFGALSTFVGGKSMKLRKIGAILIGAGLLGATLAPIVAAKDVPPTSFFVNSDGNPAAMIVVGDGAAASDVVAASLIAAKIGSIAVKTETVTLPGVQHSVTHTDIGPGDTVADVPDATPYGGIPSGNYTLDSLWWFDDNGGVLYGNSNGKFDPWETHEEIQIRFDDFWTFHQLSGYDIQDHKADLVGGDFNFWGVDPTRPCTNASTGATIFPPLSLRFRKCRG